MDETKAGPGQPRKYATTTTFSFKGDEADQNRLREFATLDGVRLTDICNEAVKLYIAMRDGRVTILRDSMTDKLAEADKAAA